MCTITFNSKSYTETTLNSLPSAELVNIYNDAVSMLKNGKYARIVEQFDSHAVGVSRTWKILQRWAEAHKVGSVLAVA